MFNRLEEIKQNLYKHLEIRIELFKTELQGGIETAVIQLLYLIVLLILIFVTGVFLLIMAAIYFNYLLKSQYAGFGIVSGFLAVSTFVWASAQSRVQVFIKRMLRWVFVQKRK